MADRALYSRAVGEHISVTGQVKRMVSATLHEHQVSHVVVLLSAGWSTTEVVLLLLQVLVVIVIVT